MKKILSFVLILMLVMTPMLSLATDSVIPDVSPQTSVFDGKDAIVGTIVGTLQWVGYAVAIVMILWLGIQWMLAQPAKKAELKGKMWSMAIGIILLVGGVSILSFVWTAAQTGTEQLGQ